VGGYDAPFTPLLLPGNLDGLGSAGCQAGVPAFDFVGVEHGHDQMDPLDNPGSHLLFAAQSPENLLQNPIKTSRKGLRRVWLGLMYAF
jgi:hypothetical protein